MSILTKSVAQKTEYTALKTNEMTTLSDTYVHTILRSTFVPKLKLKHKQNTVSINYAVYTGEQAKNTSLHRMIPPTDRKSIYYSCYNKSGLR